MGNEEQKKRWIEPFTNGEKVGCFALSEPGVYCTSVLIHFNVELEVFYNIVMQVMEVTLVQLQLPLSNHLLAGR